MKKKKNTETVNLTEKLIIADLSGNSILYEAPNSSGYNEQLIINNKISIIPSRIYLIPIQKIGADIDTYKYASLFKFKDLIEIIEVLTDNIRISTLKPNVVIYHGDHICTLHEISSQSTEIDEVFEEKEILKNDSTS